MPEKRVTSSRSVDRLKFGQPSLHGVCTSSSQTETHIGFGPHRNGSHEPPFWELLPKQPSGSAQHKRRVLSGVHSVSDGMNRSPTNPCCLTVQHGIRSRRKRRMARFGELVVRKLVLTRPKAGTFPSYEDDERSESFLVPSGYQSLQTIPSLPVSVNNIPRQIYWFKVSDR